MEKNPNYILKSNEATFRPKKNIGFLGKIKPIIYIIIVIIIIGSFVFGENLFDEMSGTARILLVLMAVGVFLTETEERVPSSFEIRFYDEYLVVYRENHYYSNKLSRKEYSKLFYKDIKECQYRVKTQRINMYGIVENIWYNYNKDGTVDKKPSYHKTTDSICYFYTMFASEVDFVAEIEGHSPIKVTVSET